jgi:hypothetical protein
MSRREWLREVEVRCCYMGEEPGFGMAVGIQTEDAKVVLRIVAGPTAA